MEYHEQSLKNLGVAMQRTKRLCAIIVDTIGREIMIKRPFSLDEVRINLTHDEQDPDHTPFPCGVTSVLELPLGEHTSDEHSCNYCPE